MSSKKKLKKKVKKLIRKVGELQDTTIGTLWFITNMIKVYDNNMDLIQKTMELFVEKINALEDKIEAKNTHIEIDSSVEDITGHDTVPYNSTEDKNIE